MTFSALLPPAQPQPRRHRQPGGRARHPRRPIRASKRVPHAAARGRGVPARAHRGGGGRRGGGGCGTCVVSAVSVSPTRPERHLPRHGPFNHPRCPPRAFEKALEPEMLSSGEDTRTTRSMAGSSRARWQGFGRSAGWWCGTRKGWMRRSFWMARTMRVWMCEGKKSVHNAASSSAATPDSGPNPPGPPSSPSTSARSSPASSRKTRSKPLRSCLCSCTRIAARDLADAGVQGQVGDARRAVRGVFG
ncbi:hypothetical protein C8R47DRAFT_133527 [Mycena vitilis]|nr:hypothetical protein C8R47DRAFT_133527 [Mycena vitilis]